MSWEVIMRVAKPHPDHAGGVVVYLSDGVSPDSVVARVAWDRLGAKQPFHTFKGQLRRAIARAEAEAARLNAAAQ